MMHTHYCLDCGESTPAGACFDCKSTNLAECDKEHSDWHCDECDRYAYGEAGHHCKECDESLCETCAEKHQGAEGCEAFEERERERRDFEVAHRYGL